MNSQGGPSDSDDYTDELADVGRLPTDPPPRREIPEFKNLPPMLPQQLATGSILDPDRLAEVRDSQFPLMRALTPLLRALREMPFELDGPRADALHARLLHEVTAFQCVCKSAGVPEADTIVASYVMCTALDEAANASVRDASSDAERASVGAWASRMLSTHFHQDGHGGVRFFQLVGYVAGRPRENIELLELLLVLLHLGFEGMYRNRTNGRRQLEDLRYQLREVLSNARHDGA